LVSLLAEGLNSKQIAKSLMISEGMAKIDLSRLFQKVGAKDRYELALLGLRNLTVGPLPASKRAGSPVLKGSGTQIRLLPETDALVAVKPVQFYSCFISYSTSDPQFAERLHADLQANGVRCWFAPHNMKGGDRLHDQIEQAIEVHDRLLLLLSGASMASKWVEAEIRKALAKEKREARRVLFPLALVPFEQVRSWQCFDSDTGRDLAREVREYFVPDFCRWKDLDAYQAALRRLLQDLRAEVSKSESIN
jgi:hypothetical protein